MSKFKIWIDDDKVLPGDAGNVLASDVLDTDVQRINGFKSGTDVSSKRVNSILRQNSLVSKALMDLSENNTFDYNSTLENIKTAIKNLSNYTVNFTQASALSNITSGEKLSTTLGKISKQLDALSRFMKYSDPDQFGDGNIRMTSTNSQNCVQDSYWEPTTPNSAWKGFEIEEENRELILNDVNINGVINKVNPYVVCMKKALFIGNIICPKNTTTNIALNGEIKPLDTLEIEYVFSANSFRPIRMVTQVPDIKGVIAFSVPVYMVHLIGGQYLELRAPNSTTISCAGSISIGSNRDYDSSVRILSISKIHYKSNASST